MSELVSIIPLADLGFTGVLVVVVAGVMWAIITGRLVPVQTHKRELEGRDKQILHLTNAHDTLSAAHGETTRQNTQLIESLRITDRVLESMHREAGEPT